MRYLKLIELNSISQRRLSLYCMGLAMIYKIKEIKFYHKVG